MSKLRYFNAYVDKLDWDIIPIWENTKQPFNKEWTIKYNKERARQAIAENPNLNLGLRLGDIVDVEADTEKTNYMLNKIIGNYPHPVYRSARSTHHLFQTPNHFLSWTQFDGIEFRGYGHQSLLPPSVVENVHYKWVKVEFPIPPMPKSLLKFYWKNVNRLKRLEKKKGQKSAPLISSCIS